MRRFAFFLTILALAFLPLDAHAISAGCLPGTLPVTPGPDAVGRNFQWGSADFFHGSVWRVACVDDPGQVALLFRVTPQSAGPFVCSSSFDLIQGGQQIAPIIRQSAGGSSFCNDLLVATTFILERQSGPEFTPTGAFTLSHDGSSAGIKSLEVPAGSAPPQLGITLVSTGCNPCSAGQTATFHIHVVNPGALIGVELKTGLRFPNGGPLFTLLGVHVEDTLEPGEFDIPLASIVVPGDAPNGAYTLEAAILEPILGTTLSRHSVQAVKQ